MRCRFPLPVLLVGLLLASVGLAPAVRAEDAASEERAVAALHPFGVRGLKHAYADCARPEERRQAIAAGLAWLTAHQAPDGAWRPDELHWFEGKKVDGGPTDKGKGIYTTGVTGMVAAAYLGAGHTHRGKTPNDVALRKALTWLVKQQDDEGCVTPRVSQQYPYNHAFATLALVEAYALTGDRHLKVPAQKALDFSALARNPGAAWRYGIKPGDNDTSLTGCMGLPLYVAQRLNRAGLRAGQLDPLSVDDSAFGGIRWWLDRITDPDYGRAGYVMRGTGPARPQEHVDAYPGEKSESCTAIAVLMRQLLPPPRATKKEQEHSDRMVARGIRLMLELKPAWTPGGGNIDLYYWYYATMAMRHAGGEAWAAWDVALTDALLAGQEAGGAIADVKGSWPAQAVWSREDGGRIYATAMSLLALETPDRMHPLPEDRSDLLRALEAGIDDPGRLASVLRGIGVLRVEGAGQVVVPYLGHADPLVAAAAGEALQFVEVDAAGVKALGTMLDDKRVPVRRAAVRAIAAQGERASPLVARLGTCLDDKDDAVAVGAARALGGSGAPEAAALLAPRLEGGTVALRVAAAGGYYRLTKDATKTLPVLIAGLAHAEDDVRIDAARALEHQSPDIAGSEDALGKALADKHVRVKLHAAGALFRAGKRGPDAIRTWIDALGALDARARFDAMERLATVKVGWQEAVPALGAQLLTGPTTLRRKAAEVLGAMGTDARPAAAALAWCRGNGPTALRAAADAAYTALALDAAAAKIHLLDAFEAKDRRLVEGTVQALVGLGAPVVPHVVATLAKGDGTTKAWMLDTLRRMGPEAVGAVDAVGRLVELAPDPKIRWRAAQVLTAVGPKAAPALGALRMALDHEKDYVREAALEAIGAIAPASKDAVALLVRIAGDTDAKRAAMRATALRALGGLGKDGDDALDVLIQGLTAKPDDPSREAAIDALVALFPHVEKDLAKRVDDDDARIRSGIAFVVMRVGPEAKRFVKPLAKLLEEKAPGGPSATGKALASIGKPAVRGLVKLLRSDKPNVRGEAARALGLIGPDAKRALKDLKKLVRDQDWNVQMRVKEAIALIEARTR